MTEATPPISAETHDQGDAIDIPSAPRSITARARRRSWAERSVRLWSILSTLLAFATVYLAIRDISVARRDRWLIEHGVPVNAKVLLVDGNQNATRSYSRDEVRHVQVSYSLPSNPNREYKPEIEIPTKPNAYINFSTPIPLHVHPDDPTIITTQTEARPWLASLAVLTLMAPALALSLVVMLWQRQRVLRVWREGELSTATVVDWHRSGLAPRSDVVRFTVEGDEDGTLRSFFWPHSAGQLNAGDEIDIVHPKDEPKRAIAAEFYV